jgi:hypothetical protein
MRIKIRKLSMTKRNLPRNPKPRKGMKTNHPTLKKNPPKDPQWFAMSKVFSYVQRMKFQPIPEIENYTQTLHTIMMPIALMHLSPTPNIPN